MIYGEAHFPALSPIGSIIFSDSSLPLPQSNMMPWMAWGSRWPAQSEWKGCNGLYGSFPRDSINYMDSMGPSYSPALNGMAARSVFPPCSNSMDEWVGWTSIQSDGFIGAGSTTIFNGRPGRAGIISVYTMGSIGRALLHPLFIGMDGQGGWASMF